MKRILFGIILAVLVVLPLPAAAVTFNPPIPGRVVRTFQPPELRWQRGHRGVDLAGRPGEDVRAPAPGRVTFAGPLAGRGVVVVDHGPVRTTYAPVDPKVPVGRTVATGEVLGILEAGHACPAPGCLHWGLRRGEDYLDPLEYFFGPVVLLPVDDPQRARAASRSATAGFRRPGLILTDSGEAFRLPARGGPVPIP